MLAPETRVLLGDALRPPDAHRLDVAVGTTYSLDLTALLLAPMSFALIEAGEDLAHPDPSALLAAVRRYSERTTVFCQAGVIAVPTAYRSILTFVEGSVHEVTPPTAGKVFHPKIWALRFVARDGAHLHRLVVLSRNLTFDRSWDTVLVLDEGESDVPAIDTAPLAGFLRALPGLSVRPVPQSRLDQVESLASTIAHAQLAPPAPFDTGTLLPLGPPGSGWPFPPTADRVLVVSPFLDATALRRVGGMTDQRLLVSRPETLERLGGKALDGWQTRVFSRFAEGLDVEGQRNEAHASGGGGESEDGPVQPTDGPTAGWGRIPDGLHAKVLIADVGDRAHVITGSANLTSAGWGGNVEFGVLLTGPIRTCGITATLGAKETDGLARLLEEFRVSARDPLIEPQEATEKEIDRFHQALATGSVRVDVTPTIDDDVVMFAVTIDIPANAPGVTRIWPITLKPNAHAQPLAPSLTWADLSLGRVTPFIAIETTAGTGPARVTRRFVLRAEIFGDPPGRSQRAVHDILRSVDEVVRYLALLLADPILGPASVLPPGPPHGAGHGASAATHDAVLLEPLVRAAARDGAGLARIAGLIDELRGENGLMPEGFDELWAVVREVALEGVQK